jgi:hypothetical protein
MKIPHELLDHTLGAQAQVRLTLQSFRGSYIAACEDKITTLGRVSDWYIVELYRYLCGLDCQLITTPDSWLLPPFTVEVTDETFSFLQSTKIDTILASNTEDELLIEAAIDAITSSISNGDLQVGQKLLV